MSLFLRAVLFKQTRLQRPKRDAHCVLCSANVCLSVRHHRQLSKSISGHHRSSSGPGRAPRRLYERRGHTAIQRRCPRIDANTSPSLCVRTPAKIDSTEGGSTGPANPLSSPPTYPPPRPLAGGSRTRTTWKPGRG